MSQIPFESLFDPEDIQIPLVLRVTLQVSTLCFPDLVYSGKVISDSEDQDDCELCLFARDLSGEPLPEYAINLEIVKVGEQRSITAEYPEQEDLPILWYGQHALWMDGVTGQTVGCPTSGIRLERLARGILKKLDEVGEIQA